MKTLKLLTIGFFVFGATILAAETLPTKGPLAFSIYDKDNNNVITAKEFDSIKQQRMNQKAQTGKLMRNAGNSAKFSDIETNNDENMTSSELETYQEKKLATRMNKKNMNMKNKGMGQGQGMGQGKKQ